jgi:selenide,water dikinase
LVGLDSADDAAVWKLDERQSLVITTDFFTPVVDDPYDYGAIAAANSLSDVYAMGAKPFLALNISAFPSNLPNEITQAIVRGAAEKCREAGVVIAGGHTITDNEPKFGLVAIGIAESDRILTKGGAKPGDHLFLSKPLGFGVTTTAMKRGLTSSEDVAEVTGWMKRLNRETGQLAVDCGLKSATDITGFGLLGHASEIALASGVGLDFEYDQIPFIDACHKFARAFTFPGGASDNKLYFEWQVSFDLALNDAEQMLLFDPQTSGGLLMCVPEDKVGNFQKLANERGILVWEIGVVSPEPGLRVHRS